jgi:hypothetical protein
MQRLALLLLLLLVILACSCRPTEAFEDPPKEEETIFVSVASYRDALCPKTLDSMYENASKPDRVYVGICQQNDASTDKDCERSIAQQKYRKNIRTIRLSHSDAKGPTWARYLCSTLWNGETYFLQIDSHTLFAKGWDEKLIGMVRKLVDSGVQKPCLSHYPPNYDDHDKDNGQVTTICKGFFNDRQMISLEGAGWQPKSDTPKPNAYIAAGMFFAPAKLLEEVPFDPDLPYLFVGEEILHSARLYTHGWDIFTPSESVVFHYYTREGEPKFWDNSKKHEDARATQKVMALLGLSKDSVPVELSRNLGRYGLGKERTLQQYFDHAGIDPKAKKVNKTFCT